LFDTPIGDPHSKERLPAVFRSCLESGKHKSDIQNDMQVAAFLQINGTPAFLIGKATGDEVSGAIVVGAQPFSVFEAKLKEAGALNF
jgi:predicted DsbA family dithiol-disulfide isomerase